MAHMHSEGATPDHGPIRHEESDVNVGAVLKFVVYLTVVGAVVQVLIWFLMGFFEAQAATEKVQYPMAVGQEERVPPAPRLQIEPRDDFNRYFAQEQELLNGYRWIDKDAGLVRIPIDQAKKLVVDQGLPTRPAQESGQKP